MKTLGKVLLILVVFQFSCASGDLNRKNSNLKVGMVLPDTGLIMRSKPSTSGDKVQIISADEKVYVEDENGPAETINNINSKWIKVNYKDKSGWVFGGFLDIQEKDDIGPVYQIYKSVGNLQRIFGLIDKSGKVIVEPKFVSDLKFSFHENLALVKEYGEKGKYGFINKRGEYVINPQFEYANNFNGGMAAVRTADKSGFIDKTGKFVITVPKFGGSEGFSEGLAAVSMDRKYGYINRWNKFVIKHQFDSAYEFSEGLASVAINGKMGYINKSGEVVIKPVYDSSKNFNDGLAKVKIKDGWGYIDKTGKIVINPIYDRAEHFFDGIAFVSSGRGGTDGRFIDKTGKTLCASGKDYEINKFCDEYAKKGRPNFIDNRQVVKMNKKYGYIDRTGKIVIKIQFDWAGDFRDGLAPVEIAGKRGYIDKDGEIIMKPQFRGAYEFQDGLAEVSIKEGDFYQKAYIDKKGKIVWIGEKEKEKQ